VRCTVFAEPPGPEIRIESVALAPTRVRQRVFGVCRSGWSGLNSPQSVARVLDFYPMKRGRKGVRRFALSMAALGPDLHSSQSRARAAALIRSVAISFAGSSLHKITSTHCVSLNSAGLDHTIRSPLHAAFGACGLPGVSGICRRFVNAHLRQVPGQFDQAQATAETSRRP